MIKKTVKEYYRSCLSHEEDFGKSHGDVVRIKARHVERVLKVSYWLFFIPIFSYEIIIETNL
jgi:hypothetical protein